MAELISIMKIFIITLILIFNIQSWTKADDIKDYEIEEISIGQSVLKYFSLNEIEQNKWDYYSNKEYTPLQFDNPSFAKIYDGIDIQYKTNDKDYKIEGLSGIIFYRDKEKIKDCYKKMDGIIVDVRSIFSNLNEYKKKKLLFTQGLTMEEKVKLQVYILNLKMVMLLEYNVIIIPKKQVTLII